MVMLVHLLPQTISYGVDKCELCVVFSSGVIICSLMYMIAAGLTLQCFKEPSTRSTLLLVN